jgi:hypothetical protein
LSAIETPIKVTINGDHELRQIDNKRENGNTRKSVNEWAAANRNN